MKELLSSIGEINLAEVYDSLDDEVIVTKKDVLFGGVTLLLAGIVIGMCTAMKQRPPMPPMPPAALEESESGKCCKRGRKGMFHKCCK